MSRAARGFDFEMMRVKRGIPNVVKILKAVSCSI
jgi:hypothetical protein